MRHLLTRETLAKFRKAKTGHLDRQRAQKSPGSARNKTKRIFARGPLVILAAAPLLMAAIWMDNQQSYKPYKAPVLAPPAGAVPVTGREIISRESLPKNPVPPTPSSLAEGKALFEINCAICHGQNSTERGPVGKKLVPPPPGLDHAMVKGLDDSTIFKAITFGFGRMPPFQDKLMPRERWNLVNFLRSRE